MNEARSARETLEKSGFFATTTVGSSMRPLLKNRRDSVMVVPKTSPLKRGDIALYERGEQLVLHRVVSQKDGIYKICGDNTYTFEFVPEKDIIGVVSEFYRKDKHYTVNCKGYKLYTFLWLNIIPARFFVTKICRKIRRKV